MTTLSDVGAFFGQLGNTATEIISAKNNPNPRAINNSEVPSSHPERATEKQDAVTLLVDNKNVIAATVVAALVIGLVLVFSKKGR